MCFSSTRENVRNNEKDLLNNNITLNELIKSSGRQMSSKHQDLFFFRFPSQE